MRLVRRVPAVWWRRAFRAWIVVFTGLTFYAIHGTRNAADENRQRIIDMQQSRVASCRQTYEGIREVFRPFFPPEKGRTARQKADLDKFTRIIERRKAHCAKQTTRGVKR